MAEKELDLESVIGNAGEEEMTLKTADDNCDNVIQYSINFLPPEILSLIFACLLLKDRKNARLVCKYWNKCTLVKSVAKDEKFILQTHHNEQEVIKSLQSDFVRPNLEFRNFTLDSSKLSIDFWKTCGPKIQSLNFFKCKWNFDMMKNIIVFCINLKSLTIESYSKPSEEMLTGTCTHEFLNKLIRNGVKRPKLDTLIIYHDTYPFGPDVGDLLNKFLLICPGIKHFRIGIPAYPKYTGREILPLVIDEFQSLTSLAFNYWTPCTWIEDSSKLQHEIRLTEFETMVESEVKEEMLLAFFKKQFNLRTIILYFEDGRLSESEFCEKLVLHCLENCLNLRYFSIDHVDLQFTHEEVARFTVLIKNLKFLQLDLGEPSSPQFCFGACYGIITSPLNYSFTALSLTDTRISREILKHCPLLKNLRLVDVRTESLQIIFEYLPNLEKLELKGHKLHIFGEGKFKISRLQKLKSLYLYCYHDSYCCKHELEVKMLCELQSPFLECLSLRVCGLDLEASTHSLSNISAVRFLCLPAYNGSASDYSAYLGKVVEFCKHLKNLYHLVLPSCWWYCTGNGMKKNFDAEDVMKMCKACPSLRYVENAGQPFTSFYFDSIANEVIQLDKDSIKCRWTDSDISVIKYFEPDRCMFSPPFVSNYL